MKQKSKTNKNRKGLKRLAVVSLITVQLMTLLSPYEAYAEDDVEGEGVELEVSTSVRNGNIYADGNQLAMGAFESASTYDPYVHYVTTYNTLVSRMNQSPKTTPYAKVYSGEVGSAEAGSGKEIVNEHGAKDTNALSIITEVEELVDEDATVGDALNESPAKDMNENEIKAEIEKLSVEIADAITKNVIEVLSSNLSINLGSGDVKYHSREGHGYNVGSSFFGQIGDRDAVGSGYYNMPAVQLNLGSASANSVYEAELKAVMRSSVGKSGFGIEKLETDFSKDSALGKKIQQAEREYEAEYAMKKVDTATTGLYLSPSGKWYSGGDNEWYSIGNDWSYVGSLSSWDGMDENLKYLIRTSGAKDTEAGRAITTTSGVEFVKSRYMHTYENLPVDKETIGKAINNAYNKALTDNSKKVNNLKIYLSNNALEVGDNHKTVAWTPIYPEVVAEGDDYDSITKYIKDVDTRLAISGDAFTLAGSDRALQGMDMFIDTDNPSPVLMGARLNGGIVSNLHLGSVSGSVNSGAKNTNQYVWFLMNTFNNVKKQNESFYKISLAEQKGNYLLGTYSREVDDYSGSFLSGTVGKDATIGADNYGNVINGETGEVLVPYWHNHMFEGVGLNDHFFPYSPMIGTYGELYTADFEDMLEVEGLATNDEIKEFVGGDNSLYKDAIAMKKMLQEAQTIENSLSVLENGHGSLSKEVAMRGLATVISASTQEAVQEWNEKMLADAKDGEELYVSFEPLLVDKSFEDEMNNQRWTAASLIQKIGWIMDYGFSDVMQLTVVSNLTRTYNTTVAEAGLEYIFYTDNITNSEGWANMTVLIATVIGAVMTAYILLVGFKAYRGEVAWSKVLVKVLVLGGVLLYPVTIYGNLVNYTINKPTSWIMGNQMRLSVILDTYFVQDNTTRDVNEFYENMFGKYADADAMQLGSYNITFYTTTDKNGFDINTADYLDGSFDLAQRRRLERYQTGVAEYPKDQLVSVHVPLVDLYKWVWDVRYQGQGMDNPTYGRGSEMPTYSEVVEQGHVDNLFNWLAKGGSSYFGVTGYDEELASYEEYKIMPDIVKPLDDVDVMNTEGLSTYGAGVQHYAEQTGYSSGFINHLDVETALDLEVLSASELFYEIVYNLSRDSEDESLQALTDISYLATTPKNQDTRFYVPTDGDMRALVRDLSNTSRGREYWYGDSTGWSNFTRAVLDGAQGTNGEFIDIEGVPKRLERNPGLTPPSEDFLGLTHVVRKYTPNRNEINPYRRRTLEEDVSSINSGLLDSYLSTYYITKMSLGADEGRNQIALNHSEKMVMATEAFFQFNDALGWQHFPQEYAVDSIKFDKYLALVFIPFKDYGQPTMTFYDDSTVIPMSTAEYIGMNESVWGYGLFMIAVIALVIFGMFYLAVLYFGLLFFSLYNFVKYYVIKSDFQNKSALGSVMIILIMSLSKMGLMLVVWICSWLMNRSIALSPMNLPAYPTTMLHSFALIGSVFGVFWFVIKPTWKGVMGDKDNMGGQFFADKAGEVGKKITSGGFLPGRGKGVNGGSQASKFNKDNKRSGKDMKNNAGRLGNLDEKGLNKARKQAGTIGTAFGVGSGGNFANSTKRRVGQVNDALQRTKDKVKGIDRTGRKFVDPSKVKASNLIERRQLSTLGNKMNNIVQTASGLGVGAVKTAVAGQQLANFQTGMITTMAMGSAGAATIVAKNLMDKGIKARTDGNNVLFDSSGYDLNDQSVRSELFNNSVADLQNQNVLKHANVQKGKVDGSTAINYDYSKGDSRIDLAMDSKTGVHPETFNQLSQTKEFKELFITPRPEELTYDRKGNIIGLPEGGLRLVNPQMSVSEVQNKMNNLYNADTKIREENNLTQRDESDKSGINIDGMDENYYNQTIAPLIKDQKGMYTQGSRIVYDKTNINHQQALRQVNKKVDEYNNSVEQGYGNESNNLMRYVVNEGDNQGIVTETVHGDDNKVLATMVHGNSNYKQNVTKFKVDETEIGQVGDNVQAVNKLRNVALNDSKLSNTVNEFTEAKKDLRTLLSKEVSDMSSNDRVTYNQEMMGYLDNTQVSNTPEYKTVKANLHSIEQQFKQNEISADQYHELIRRENDNLTTIMDATGKLDGFILNRYDSKNPYIKKYEEKVMARNKDNNKEHKTLKDKYNESVDKLDKKVGRKNLMEMPLGVVESTVSKHGEEYQLDGKGVLVQRADSRRKRTSLDGKDKDSVMSYLMKRPLEVRDIRSRKLASK